MDVVNPIANPKGVKQNCELCGKTAHVQCVKCRVTFYCDRDHLEADLQGIHTKICPKIQILRAAPTTLGTEEDRKERAAKRRQIETELLEIAVVEAHKNLSEGKFDYAIPAALQALRFSIEVYGQDSLELVPAYLLLGEASIGLKKHQQAEDYLSLAKWAILKATGSNDALQSQLYRNYGLLHFSKGDLDQAAKDFALDVYHASIAIGPAHISVAGGYFHLGTIFYHQKKIVQCQAFFEKVYSIWDNVLTSSANLSEDKWAEAEYCLQEIAKMSTLISAGRSVADVNFMLSKIFNKRQRHKESIQCATKSIEWYENNLGKDHARSAVIRDFMKQLEVQ